MNPAMQAIKTAIEGEISILELIRLHAPQEYQRFLSRAISELNTAIEIIKIDYSNQS